MTESKNKVETVEQAIQQITEDELAVSKQSVAAADDEDFENTGVCRRRKLLLGQLSQSDSLQEDEKLCPEMDNNSEDPIPNEEMMKELKIIKRQNLITHCLLSTLIVLTVARHISEISLILKVKNALSNPVKFVGGIIRGLILKGGPQVNVEEAMKQRSPKQKQVTEPTSLLPGIKLPLLDLSILDSSDED